MLHGSWLMAQGGPGAAARGVGRGGAAAPGPTWAVGRGPLAIDGRLINELFDYIL